MEILIQPLVIEPMSFTELDGPDTQAFGNLLEPGTTKIIGETERTVGLCLSFTCMDRLAD